MSRPNGRPQGVGKYEKADPKPMGMAFYVGNTRQWCYLCARSGQDPYHSWEEHHDAVAPALRR